MAAIKVYGKKCIILAISTNRDSKDGISPVSTQGFSEKLAGTTYPMLVIVSPDQTVRYDSLSNKELYNKKRLKAALTTSLEKIKTHKPTLPGKDELIMCMMIGKPGFCKTFYLGGVIDENTMLATRKKGGNMKKISIKGYTDGTKIYIKTLMGVKKAQEQLKWEKKLAELMPTLEEEEWKNNKGKTIKGTFVSLQEGLITISMKRHGKAKSVTFALDKLGDASQVRAKKIADQMIAAKKTVAELKEGKKPKK